MTGAAAVLVVGATGTTGTRVAARLTAQGVRVTAASRGAAPVAGAEAVRFDWYDPGTHDRALRGADGLYLIPPLGSAEPAGTVLPFLERARAAGVRRAVLLSSSAIPAGGMAAGRVHAQLPEVFGEWAVLRPSWFMDNFTGDHAHARSIRETGEVLTATDGGRVGFVDADDIAAVAARALTADRSPDTDLVLTGPEALSYADAAAVIAEETGRAVVHRRLTREGMRDRLAREIPEEFAAVLADLDAAIAEGAEDRTTDTVERITQSPPRDFRTHVRRHAQSLG
ncbi:NAD(P)H-binding protein [Streptomonospora salina]|uniref:Uncharacterized protein YbjT (DUF2867 family) n=1 Tax=Streptomonospora salina TaxID=104205 RepID=A0A841E027_9ACTN|nr:NAD(P)H-binding protein [Streptomonospora salina]MBB5996485.1 uncharacterized protein YbjT (DUF2867 family) [Streptomonospora salina]